MANIIDSLIVELGLDPANFEKGTKDAAAALVDLRKKTDTEAKGIADSGRKAAEFFTTLRNQALLWTSVALGGKGIGQFINDTTKAGLASKNLAANIGADATKLSVWTNMADAVGLSTESVTGAFVGLYNALEDFKLKGEASDAVKMFAQFGISLGTIGPDGVVHLRDAFEIMKDIGDLFKNHREDAMRLGAYMGFTPDFVTLLARGREALGEMEKAQQSLYFETERDREADERWIQTRKRMEQVAREWAKNRLTEAILTGLPKDEKAKEDYAKEVERISTTGAGGAIGNFLGASVAFILASLGNKEAMSALRMNAFNVNDGYFNKPGEAGAAPAAGGGSFQGYAGGSLKSASLGQLHVYLQELSESASPEDRAALIRLTSGLLSHGNLFSPGDTAGYLAALQGIGSANPSDAMAQAAALSGSIFAGGGAGKGGSTTTITIGTMNLETDAKNGQDLKRDLANTKNYGMAAQANTGPQ